MKRIVITSLLIMAFAYPAFADNSTDINNQKSDIQIKYDNEKNSENQDYNAKVAEAKQNYSNDPDKLDNDLKQLQLDHHKKIDDLNDNEKMDLQKVESQNNS